MDIPCERCRNPDITEVTTYTVTKADGTKRRATLCDSCRDSTAKVHKVSGGKTSEAEPSTSNFEPQSEPDANPTKSLAVGATEGGGVKPNPAKKRR